MEKPVRYCSMISIVVTGAFFLAMFTGAGIGANGATGRAYQVIAVIANVLLYVAPIFFLVTLTIGLMCILRRTMAGKNTAVSARPKEKFPTILFLIAIVMFILFLLFVAAIMSTME